LTAADDGKGRAVPGTVDRIALTRAGDLGRSGAAPWPTGHPGPEPALVPAMPVAPAVPAGLPPSSRHEFAEQLTGQVLKWYVRAAEHHNCGRPDRAAGLLVSALALEPSLACLREALARAQYDARQYLAARTTFTAMTAIDPCDHYALFGLGLVETRLGVYAAAAAHLARAVSLDPGDSRYELALEHVQEVLRQNIPARTSEYGQRAPGARR
jgi:tetratricopeptide (TPR) repeat protein